MLSTGRTACCVVLQVYRATLRPELGGGDVAIKVLRPGVLEQVRAKRRGFISWRRSGVQRVRLTNRSLCVTTGGQ